MTMQFNVMSVPHALLALAAAVTCQAASANDLKMSTELSRFGSSEVDAGKLKLDDRASVPAGVQSVAGRPDVRPSAFEMGFSKLKMPTGESVGFLSGSYLVAMNQDWGIGPSAYGAATGQYGGLFTAGFTAQGRWLLGQDVVAAASLYAGAGGGVGSDKVRFGGGLMIRPELSLRTAVGRGSYLGLSVAHTRFPSGNIRSTGWGLIWGMDDRFISYPSNAAGQWSLSSDRSGFGFDRMWVHGGINHPDPGSLNRSGQPLARRMGTAGFLLEQQWVPGQWWALEASGAAAGGADGYAEVLGVAGLEWPVASLPLKAGVSAGVGLGGGGNLDTGGGLVWRAGPTARLSLGNGWHLGADAGWRRAPTGRWHSRYVRAHLGFDLDSPGTGWTERAEPRQISMYRMMFLTQGLNRVTYKDGSAQPIKQLGIAIERDWGQHAVLVGQAGSAAWGKAGAYSYGLFGAGLRWQLNEQWRVGLQSLVGAGGGGGVKVAGGAITQNEVYAMWQGERWNVKGGLGQWRNLRGEIQSTPTWHLGVGYAFGAAGH